MEIKGKSIMILGGWGQVGMAVGRAIIQEHPTKLVISSLKDEEAEKAVEELKKLPNASEIEFFSFGGNILVREGLEKIPSSELLSTPNIRAMLIEDIFGERFFEIAENSFIYKQFHKYQPDIVVDCINSATALAYQPLYTSVGRIRKTIKNLDNKELADEVEKLICTLYIPQLIRHVQIMYYTMRTFRTAMYIKIGTSGTGGMGLNIPYTHSEERPSNALLSKSSVAGAHTLLLYLMARTPDAPIVKEIKPTAAICWKEIDYGKILKKGREIHLHDCPPETAFTLSGQLKLNDDEFSNPIGDVLQSIYIDTGENGQFSLGEFMALTTLGQMEFVTPEEIAAIVVSEIKGGNTGHDMISAFDVANLGPSYRAGVLRTYAIGVMKKMERDLKTDSVAFEILGPPRLSKLLYEAFLLKQCCSGIGDLATSDPETLSQRVEQLIISDTGLRAKILSIGIPILLKDGKSLLRGPEICIPVSNDNVVEITEVSLEKWTEAGWVDLRKKNMQKWINRAQKILKEAKNSSNDLISSQFDRGEWFWNAESPLEIGEIVGWIFITEDNGVRAKR